MKKVKRLLSFVLALVMIAGMSLTAFAEEAESGNKIILRDKYSEHTYEAYQIFAGVQSEGILSDVTWGEHFNKDKAADFLAALQAGDGFGNNFDSLTCESSNPDKFAAALAEKIATLNLSHDAQLMQDFADLLHAKDASGNYIYLNTANPYTSEESRETDEKENYVYTIDGTLRGETAVDNGVLPDGYYLVKDKDGSLYKDGTPEYDFYTRLLLLVVGDVDTQPKGDVPAVEKSVSEKIDGRDGHSVDAAITDTVYFVLRGTLPSNLSKYETYSYTFYDTLSEGLDMSAEDTFQASESASTDFDRIKLPGIVDAYIYHASGTNTTELSIGSGDDSRYMLKADTLEDKTEDVDGRGDLYFNYDAATRKLTIKFYDLKKSIPTLLTDDVIVFKYAATLNEKAITGNGTQTETPDIEQNQVAVEDYGNENKVYLEFSNNPQGDDLGRTPSKDAEVFTYKLAINKVGEGNKTTFLSGAQFLLYNRILENAAILTETEEQEKDVDTTYDYHYAVMIKQTDDTYLITDWITADVKIDKFVETEVDGETKYYAVDSKEALVCEKTAEGFGNPIELSWKETGSDTEYFIYMVSDADAPICIKGLDAGTYWLHELKAPAGYNALTEDVKVAFKAVHSSTNGSLESFEVLANGKVGSVDKGNGTATITIENTKGSTLPSTGGIGTTIFYVVGGILVVGAVVLLVTRRRMSGEK